MSYLEVHDGAGDRYVPTDRYFTLGRSLSNDIVLHGNAVSRSHARILHQGGRVVLQDVGSTYGTLVNGRRIRGDVVLCDGDRVQMGDVYLVYRERPIDEPGVATVGPATVDEVTPPSGFRVLPPAQPLLSAPRSSQGSPLPVNMVRCPYCGTTNLRSNSICYNCGSALLPISVRVVAPARRGNVRATAHRSGGPGRQSAWAGWLTGFLIALALLVFCVLSVVLGLMLAGATPASLV